MTNRPPTFDLAVIGAGPCGIAVGVAAREAGVSCVLFDKGSVTSTLIGYPTHMTFFSTAERLEVGGIPFISISPKPTRMEALKYYRRVVQHFALDVRQYEDVLAVTGERGAFEIETARVNGERSTYTARNVAIATGYYDTPCLLGVDGEALPKVSHYYHEGYPYFQQDCVVIGGSNSAADVALDLFRAGARVTLVHFLEKLDPNVKPWVLPDVMNRIESGEIATRWRTRVEEFRPRSVLLRNEETGAVEELPNDWVFAMTGYKPDPRILRSLGARFDEDTGIPSFDPATMESNVPGVYIAGVIAAGNNANKIFIENGREHGGRIVASITGRRDV